MDKSTELIRKGHYWFSLLNKKQQKRLKNNILRIENWSLLTHKYNWFLFIMNEPTTLEGFKIVSSRSEIEYEHFSTIYDQISKSLFIKKH